MRTQFRSGPVSDSRRIARVAVSPEEIGLCGCWQVIAVERHSQDLTAPDASASLETGCYATLPTGEHRDDAGMLAVMRGHGFASENGHHYRHEVTLRLRFCAAKEAITQVQKICEVFTLPTQVRAISQRKRHCGWN